MSWLFSQALVEEYSEGIFLDGEPSVQSNGNPTPQAYLCSDKMMGFSRLSRFGMTFRLLTESRGEALLMSYLEGFPVRTSQPQERAQELTESDQVCGEKWQGSFTRFDPDSSSWKTHQCSLLGGLEPFSETWPRWGLMRDGECWELPTLERRTSATASGLWQTPVADDAANRKLGKWNSRGEQKLSAQVLMDKWPTPTRRDYKSGQFSPEAKAQRDQHPRGKPLNEQIGGTLNPTWVEWLMGWPLEWTNLKPLEMDKFQQWQQQHSGY